MVQRPAYTKKQMTSEGQAALEEELSYLKSVRRAEIQTWVMAAREGAHGDLADAAELAEAQRELGLVENRIAELEIFLEEAEVVATPSGGGAVSLGSTVTVRDEEGVDAFTIVPPAEAARKAGHISAESPVGQALLGMRAGESVEVETPAGRRRLEIVKVD